MPWPLGQAWLHAAAMLVACCAALAGPSNPGAEACRAVLAGDGSALQPCADSLPNGATLALPPVRLVLTRPLLLRRPVTLTTAGAAGRPRCPDDGAGCAVIALRIEDRPGDTGQPITVAGAGSMLDHLVIEGGKVMPDAAARCRGAGRPMMGGVAVRAPNVTVRDSVLRDMACFSALVAEPGADGLRFTGNAVLSNGTHGADQMWADGLTVTDATNAVIRDNLFRDNTDVQLVLGGCLRCTVANNTLLQTDADGAGAFAGILIHGWPHTSGDYDGTLVTANLVDCGPQRRCGFGIGYGGRAWYPSAASGGTVSGNVVRRAAIGISVDDATGPVTMAGNRVEQAGGPVRTRCGVVQAGAVNITERSRPYLDATAGVDVPAASVTRVDFAGCLPGPP